MNYPGKPAGNWRWRMHQGQFTDWMIDRLADWTEIFNRIPKVAKQIEKK